MNDSVQNRFRYHVPRTEEVVAAHQDIRRWCAEVGAFLDGELPAGREKSLALTKLEEVMFWANAAVARNQGD